MCLGGSTVLQANTGENAQGVHQGLDANLFFELLTQGAGCSNEALKEAPVQTHDEGSAAGTATAAQTEEDNRMLDRTKMCKFFAKGLCRRGKDCTFAHGRRELLPQPDLYRTQLCFNFAAGGRCDFGESCRYAHSFEEVRPASTHQPVNKQEIEKGCHAPVGGHRPAGRQQNQQRQQRQQRQQLDASESVREVQKAQQQHAAQLRAQLEQLQKAVPRVLALAGGLLPSPSPAAGGSPSTATGSPGSPMGSAATNERSTRGSSSWRAPSGRASSERSAAWDCGSSSGAGEACDDSEDDQVVSVALVVKNTFLGLVRTAPGASRRVKSAPPPV